MKINENTAKMADKVARGNTGTANKILNGLMGVLKRTVSDEEYEKLFGEISEKFISSQGEENRKACEKILAGISTKDPASHSEQ